MFNFFKKQNTDKETDLNNFSTKTEQEISENQTENDNLTQENEIKTVNPIILDGDSGNQVQTGLLPVQETEFYDKNTKSKKSKSIIGYKVFGDISEITQKSETDIINECALFQVRSLLKKAGKVIVRYSPTESGLEKILLLGDKLSFGEITVSPDLVEKCIKPVRKHALQDLKIGAIVGFPFGDDLFSGKASTVKSCVKMGVDQITVAMKLQNDQKGDVKEFKKQIKKIAELYKNNSGIALSVSDMPQESLIFAVKSIEKTNISSITLVFGQTNKEQIEKSIALVNKYKGKKQLKILANVCSMSDIVQFNKMGVDIVLTPYLDEIAKDLIKKLGITNIKI